MNSSGSSVHASDSGKVRLERLAILVALAVTLLFELGLAERKYALFGGGFGQSHALSGTMEIILFLVTAVTAQALEVGLAYLLTGLLLGHRARRPVRLFAFLFFTVGLHIGIVVAKFELLSYFSDAVSFGLLRNLGGGSLLDAALFGLSEGALFAQLVVGVILAWLLCLFALRRLTDPADTGWPRAIGWKTVLLLFAAMPGLLLLGNAHPNVRYAAVRMTASGMVAQALNTLTDFDRDGYSWFSPLRDDAPFDAARHPLALDIPNNGIDEDELGGDLRLAPARPDAPLAALPPHPRHLVLIVLESTRGDVLGKRIDGKPVAPNLEALARNGSSAAEAYSHVGFTTASLKSLFTGQLEPRAGAPSLFRDLKHAGYRIAVLSGQSEGFGDIAGITGMKASSDIYVDAETLKADRAFGFAAQGSLLVDETKLLNQFQRRLGNAEGWRQPTFVYFNFQSAHFPYHHDGMIDRIEPDPIARDAINAANRVHLQRTYWNAVAYSDAMIGRVVQSLKAMGVWQDTLLVVTADHGESLFEDGFLGHGHRVNRIQTHVPLVISQPGIDLSGAIGLRDYRALILRILAGQKADLLHSRKPVLRYVGDLNEPAAIGLVDNRGGLGVRYVQSGGMVRTARARHTLCPVAAGHGGTARRRPADPCLGRGAMGRA